jgi:hypothetical protein
MANPLRVTCTEDTWVKVATNVTSGVLWRTEQGNYFFTYKATGQAAPASSVKGVPIFRDGEPDYEEIIGSGIDLYIKCVNREGEVEVHV